MIYNLLHHYLHHEKIVQLADAVKRGAHSLGSSQSESQVMVINAVKDVASALGELINTTKNASGKPVNDPYMQELKESAKVSEQFRHFGIQNKCKTVRFRFFLSNSLFRFKFNCECCKAYVGTMLEFYLMI